MVDHVENEGEFFVETGIDSDCNSNSRIKPKTDDLFLDDSGLSTTRVVFHKNVGDQGYCQ